MESSTALRKLTILVATSELVIESVTDLAVDLALVATSENLTESPERGVIVAQQATLKA
jgi:hypothetical protein